MQCLKVPLALGCGLGPLKFPWSFFFWSHPEPAKLEKNYPKDLDTWLGSPRLSHGVGPLGKGSHHPRSSHYQVTCSPCLMRLTKKGEAQDAQVSLGMLKHTTSRFEKKKNETTCLDLPKGAEWMIRGAYTPSFRIKQHPLEDAGTCFF